MTLKAASSARGTITDQEIRYFQFKVYKKIKAPAEWTTHILFLESTVASTPGYTGDPFQRNTSQVHDTIEPGAVEALRQDPRGTDLGHGCSTATSQEKSQQAQAQLRAEYQNYGKG